ncbi:shikimate dehydrogenase [soil metagenome]
MVGDPVAHSLSPVIHTAALAALGIDGSYEARRVDEAGLAGVIAELRSGSLDGVNVTMPHKRAAASLVDFMSPEARRARSVNTIVATDGELVGHSTDVTGLRRLWNDRHLPFDAPALLLGAGGAAAAAGLATQGPVVYASARRPGMVEAMAAEIGRELIPLPWGTAVAEAVVVNATPVGMKGEALPPFVVDLAAAVVDLAYAAESTPTVRRGRSRGIPTVDGIDVLVAQATDSFRLWTGQVAPPNVMEAAARNLSSRPLQAPNDDPDGESL